MDITALNNRRKELTTEIMHSACTGDIRQLTKVVDEYWAISAKLCEVSAEICKLQAGHAANQYKRFESVP